MTARKRMIFHHALRFYDEPTSGSQKRPKEMLKAFEEEGFEVHAVVGDSKARAAAIARIDDAVRGGAKFDFVYHESTNIPIYLADPDHLPRHPWLDFGFFRRMRRRGTPVGLYYRDVHWLFREKRVSLAHSAATFPTFWLEWLSYLRSVDQLFLPSVEMGAYLPSRWPRPVRELPPGAEVLAKHAKAGRDAADRPLRLLYVGGISSPVYDISLMLDACRRAPFVELTLCCREAEWATQAPRYGAMPANVKVVHRQGAALADLYREADLFFFGLVPRPYLDFAMPVKIFESIGFGVPFVTFSGTCAGRFIEQEGLGWAAGTADAMEELLARLHREPAELRRVQEQVGQAQEKHSWRARARTVAEVLTRKDS